jgi:hypothetical protein
MSEFGYSEKELELLKKYELHKDEYIYTSAYGEHSSEFTLEEIVKLPEILSRETT